MQCIQMMFYILIIWSNRWEQLYDRDKSDYSLDCLFLAKALL